MKDEQINIAIAEKCGYNDVKQRIAEGTIKVITGFKEPWQDEEIPDYCNDLNAMHEAWETLTLVKKRQFETELYRVIICDGDYNRNDDAMKITNASARQRAEAFLQTLGLWDH